MARPAGVTVIAILHFLGTMLCVRLGIQFFAGNKVVSAFSDPAAESYMPTLGAILLLFVIVLPLLNFMGAWGLWNLKNWGRILTIALNANGFAFASLRWFLTPHAKMSLSVSTLVALAVSGVVMWYLLRANVKAAFSSLNQMPHVNNSSMQSFSQ